MTEATRDWKTTIRLPETDFPMRADLAKREGAQIDAWEADQLYHRMQEHRAGGPTFVLHDGPPYANGEIHHGHALNKILKDIVVKYWTLRGFQSPNIPGWDCHGLPIEQKVDELLGKKKREMDTAAFRRECRAYADKYVAVQRDGFKRLMVLAEWDRPYKTMDYAYEASTLRELGRLMRLGFVYKGLKPVHWSWSAVTALAEAEVEYARYVAPSVYVAFELPDPPAWLAEMADGRSVAPVIWTTTPWTLPSNVAIALSPVLDYVLVARDDRRAIIVAEGLLAEVAEKCELDAPRILGRFQGAALVGTGPDDSPRLEARHPFIDRASVLVPASYVTLEQGTGCVHTAPGHGAEDFQTGVAFGLPVIAPVNRYGKYTNEVADYEGVHVFQANPLIAARLHASGHLLNQPTDTYVVERYPHCWRTGKPLIFRATEQWFVAVDHDELRTRALDEIGGATWVPHWGENRIRGMIEARPDWCISRQRAWGVPIPVFACGECQTHIVEADVAEHVATMVEDHGADVWFERPVEALVPDGFVCPACGAPPSAFERGQDILDVWFDSGVSWAAVLRDREALPNAADLYLEGSDQHRGWFHTSLLTSVASQRCAPYKTVLTHGFVVDEHGRKYSKSSPNFEPLSKILDEHGAEVLRLWVAMVDYRNDMVLAPELLKQASGAYRKIRNTIRFLLGNTADFDRAAYAMDVSALRPIDRWMLSRVHDFIERMREAYASYEFHGVFHGALEFCNETLSAVYLDALKDRMYCEDPDDPARRAAQAVMDTALRALVVIVAPILSFTAEEAWRLVRTDGEGHNSVFLTDFPIADPTWADSENDKLMETILDLRSRVHAEVEARRPKKKGERLDGQIGSTQETVVTLRADAATLRRLQTVEDTLVETAIISRIAWVEGAAQDSSGVDVSVERSAEPKCERCWNHRVSVGASREYPTLCGRCVTVVTRLDQRS